jgi:branched-chain amino acid transport system ATP-binding protein
VPIPKSCRSKSRWQRNERPVTVSPLVEPALVRRDSAATAPPVLSLNNIDVVYDRVILVLKGVSLAVRAGAITALLGANGAGKSTTLKAISGVLASERGEVTKGTIVFEGRRIEGRRAHDVTRLGLAQVFEGRRVFEHLTCEENLIAGGHLTTDPKAVREGIDRAYHYFPKLKERRRQLAGYLSGGEQQMLAIGRALLADPRVMMLDEPSLGLSPRLTAEIFALIERLNRSRGLSILLVEQNTRKALQIATRAYVLELGRKVIEGTPAELKDSPLLRDAYLGRSGREAAIG